MFEEDDHDEEADDDDDDDDGCVQSISDRVGGGGLMTTLLRRHFEQHLQKSRFAPYLQCFRDVGPSYIVTKPTSGLWVLDLGISKGFLRKLELGWAEACFGDDDDDIVSRTPRTISPHPSAHTPNTTSKATAATPRSGL